jgi:hypothetical protein
MVLQLERGQPPPPKIILKKYYFKKQSHEMYTTVFCDQLLLKSKPRKKFPEIKLVISIHG